MRSKKEIREYLEALKKTRNSPCDCVLEGHALECEVGNRLLLSSIKTLEWILGSHEEDSFVELVLNQARSI